MSIAQVTDRLAADPQPVADRIVRTLVAEIPAYAALDATALESVRRIVLRYVEMAAVKLREGGELTTTEAAAFAASARARARDGLTLEDVLHAMRLGFGVIWQVVQEWMADGHDFDAAMHIGASFMSYYDVALEVVTRHHQDEGERLEPAGDRQYAELIEALLRRGTDGAGQEAARCGIRPAPRYWAVVLGRGGGPAGSGQPAELDTRALARGLRRMPFGSPILAAAEAELVVALWPALAGDGPQSMERTHPALEIEHGPLLMAVDGPACTGLAERADECRRLYRMLPGRRGVLRLQDVLLDALVHQTRPHVADTVRALAEPLPDDLRKTMATYIATDQSVNQTAHALNVHRNTVLYRLRQIHRLTGRDPRRITDLFLLHAALRLAWHPQPPPPDRH